MTVDEQALLLADWRLLHAKPSTPRPTGRA
jgi:hypothetical protein